MRVGTPIRALTAAASHGRRCLMVRLSFAVALVLAFAPSALANPTTFVVPMSGAEIVGQGDPDGTGTATITIDVKAQTLCFSIRTENVFDPSTGNSLVSAFIAAAPRGEKGGIAVVLWRPEVWAHDHDGCRDLQDLGKEGKRLLKDMEKNPQNYYVVVTSADYTQGAIRGQFA